jgi:hypothetical protein
MTTPRPRAGSLGCLGVFSILCLSFFTIFEVGVAWWLNASWFDRVAFWRAPRVQAEPAFVEGAEVAAIRKRWLEEQPARLSRKADPEPATPVLLEHARLSAEYAPGAGATVRDPGNGATVNVPAGALPRAAKVTLTPAHRVPAAMVTSFAGPVYDVRVDERDHTDFGRPIELSLPFVKGLVPNDQVVVTVWEKDRWVALPSRVDGAKGVVTATSTHASIFSVANAATLGGRIAIMATRTSGVITLLLAAAENNTTRAAIVSAFYGRSQEYETPEGNFKVHYYTYGAARIPADWEVLNDPFTPKDVGDRAPLYVRRMGHWLEFARKELHAEGFALPPAKLIRYDCFLIPVGEKGMDLGLSYVGGPLFISPRIQEIAKADAAFRADAEELMKSTCAHELLHVSQGQYYSTLRSQLPGATVLRLCEADAEYNAWRFWRKRGGNDAYHMHKYVIPNAGMTSTPFDLMGETERYAYALWFEWMHHRFGEPKAMEFFVEAHRGGDGSLADMDAAARKVLGPLGVADLGESLGEFAVDYYHRDLWTPTLVPDAVNGKKLSEFTRQYFDQAFGYGKEILLTFGTAAYKAPNEDRIVRNPFHQLSRPSIPHLSSAALYVLTETVTRDPEQPQPRLVVEVEGAAASSPSLQVTLARGVMKNPFGAAPAAGSAGDLATVPLSGGKGQAIVEGFGAQGKTNFLTILVTNRSVDADLGGLTVRRWMLEPPPYAKLEPKDKDQWLLQWKPAPLEPDREVFATYRIYRRPLGASPKSKELVKDVPPGPREGEFYRMELTGSDVGDYTYAIAIVDTSTNESDPRDAEMTDPFVGTWEGQVTLVEGSFVKPIAEAMRKAAAEADAKARARIAGIADPQRRKNEEYAWEEARKLRDGVGKLLQELMDGVEQAARLGVPLQFKVRAAGDHYRGSLSEIVWGMAPLEPEMKAEFELRRVGRDTLRVGGLPSEIPPLELTLHRMDPEGKKPNILRRDRYVLETTGEAARTVPMRCVVRWDFERISLQPPPAPK